MVAPVYPSIPHLPGSRCAADRTVPHGTARRCLDPRAALPGAEVIVQEKLDGSCVVITRRSGQLLALGREGRPCERSGNEARRWFAGWGASERQRLEPLVSEGEVLAGEWLALVHGTRYRLDHGPFVPFDLLVDGRRLGVSDLAARLAPAGLVPPRVVHRGPPIPVAEAASALGGGLHGAIDPPEGLVYRVERAGEVLLVAKWVRPSKVDGSFLPEISPALYHWTPP